MARVFLTAVSAAALCVCFSVTASAQPVAGEVMSQSFDSSTVDDGWVKCSDPTDPDVPKPANGWLRSYDPEIFGVTGDFSITGVKFGYVGFAGGIDDEQPVLVRIYSDADPAYPVLTADLTLLHEEEIVITNIVQDGNTVALFDYDFETPLLVESGTAIAVEIRNPEFPLDSPDDRFFAAGSNSLGATGQSYYLGLGAPCDDPDVFTDPIDFDLISAEIATLDLVIDVKFEGGCVAPAFFTCTDTGANVELTWSNSGVYDTLKVFRNGSPLVTLSDDAESYTDVGGGNRPRIYELRATQDDFDCTVSSIICQTGRTEECRENLDLFVGLDAGTTKDVLDMETDIVIDELDVSVDITHSWIGDLEITLESPNETQITLKLPDADPAALDGLKYADIVATFDDEGLDYEGLRLVIGEHRVKPQGPGELSDFDGEFSAGDWTLSVTDEIEFDDGFLNGWCLSVLPPQSGVLFKRGDTNGDGSTSALLDGIYLLRYQFSGGTEPPCFDAADVDGNNTVSALLDTLTLLRYSFSGGAAPADPGPTECGVDPDADVGVDCETGPGVCN